MTESYSKSKLKRKKSSAEDFRSEIFSREAKRKSLTSSSGDGAANTAGAAPPPAAPWWRTLQPPAVESLWALTLQNLENQLWDPVPGLPLPPAAKASEPNPDGARWGDLGCEVDPLPECSPLCLKTPPSQASSQQDLLVQTEPAPDPPDRSPDRPTASPPLRLQQSEEAAAAATSRELKVSAPSGPADEEEEVGGDEELQSCPMCLQAFPAGSSQMDRDGHLAQCLSDMNVDMTW